MEKSKFNNFSVLTVKILTVDSKTSKGGEPYTTAEAQFQSGQVTVPVRVVALNGLSSKIKAGTEPTLVGRLGYEESREGSRLVLFPEKVQYPITPDGKAVHRNFVSLTLRAGTDGDGRFSNKNGDLWARMRAALGFGKDSHGSYRPSLWLTIKAFTRDGDSSLPESLQEFSKGDLFEVSGRLTAEVYKEKLQYSVTARKLVPIVSQPTSEESQEDGLEEIPD
jgi:hypothetical protein